MTGNQVAYAVQAAKRIGGVILECNQDTACLANILQINYSHAEDHLYIGFNASNAWKLKLLDASNSECEICTGVKFELRHSYFHDLNELVSQFSDRSRMVDKILPNKRNFCPPVIPDDLDTYKKLCSTDQFEALQAIASCPSKGPPVLIPGPFGTGKTQTLAMAARYFLKRSSLKDGVIKILVCTHRKVSASNFLRMYLNLEKEDDTYIHFIQDHGTIPSYQLIEKYLKNLQKFQSYTDLYPNHQMLAITTCLTAHSLAKFLQPGFFTHILIDDGAQMHEPEAIAPLLMADPENTKIVIAGDDQQVLYYTCMCK